MAGFEAEELDSPAVPHMLVRQCVQAAAEGALVPGMKRALFVDTCCVCMHGVTVVYDSCSGCTTPR